MEKTGGAIPNSGWHDALRVAYGARNLFSADGDEQMRYGADTVVQTILRAMQRRGLVVTFPSDGQAGQVGTA